MKPENADFGITIDFDRGQSDPVKVFAAMAEMLQAVRSMDTILIGAVDPNLVPIMVLEDVEAASITSWVKNKLEAVDDQALKEFDWKQQIGTYAVKAKYRIIEYLDDMEANNENQRLAQLKNDLDRLASDQKIHHLPIPSPVDMKRLAKPMDQIQEAKQLLGPNDRAIFKSEGREYEINKNSTARVGSLGIEQEEQDTDGSMDMVLLVRKPDMIGNAQWEFRHGKQPLFAHVLDDDWMMSYRQGKVILIPGSYIACTVGYTHKYSATGALISSSYDVAKVHNVLPPDGSLQLDFLDD